MKIISKFITVCCEVALLQLVQNNTRCGSHRHSFGYELTRVDFLGQQILSFLLSISTAQRVVYSRNV